MYVPEAAIPQVAAIRYCTLEKKKSVSHLFRIYAVCCSVPYFRTLLSTMHFAHFCSFFFLSQFTTKLPSKHGGQKRRTPKYFLALVKPNRVKASLRQGFAETTSALDPTSVLAYDAASTYGTYCTAQTYKGPALPYIDWVGVTAVRTRYMAVILECLRYFFSSQNSLKNIMRRN